MVPVRIVVVIVVAFCTYSCSTHGDEREAHIRFIQLAPGAGTLTVFIDELRPMCRLKYGDVSERVAVSASRHLIWWSGSGSNLTQCNVVLFPDSFYTAVVFGTQGAYRLVLLTDDINVDPMRWKWRLVNASPDVPLLTVLQITEDGSHVLWDSVALGEATSWLVGRGAAIFGHVLVTETGTSHTLLDWSHFGMVQGHYCSAFIAGHTEGDSLHPLKDFWVCDPH